MKPVMRVLIIEREKTFRQSLSDFMERHKGFEVFTALSCREGMSLLGKVPFDMVLCENHLPDGNGFEMLKDLARQNPKLISVLMTAHSDELLKEEVEKAGIRGFLEKPFDLRELEEAIRIADCGFRNAE
jgi:DNA-binding NarL/FixJ family response regulator